MNTKLYTEAELQRRIDKAVERAMIPVRTETIEIMLHIAAWAEWDTVPRISKKAIGKTLQAMGEKARFILDGSVTLEDIKQMLKDETGITIGFKE